MILVDTSVWIDYFGRSPGAAGRELHRLISDAEPVALAGIIVTEILQGLARDVQNVEDFLSLFDWIEPKGFGTYQAAAALNRLGRSRGITLSTVDALIAVLALEAKAALFSLDRDFERIAAIATLELYQYDA